MAGRKEEALPPAMVAGDGQLVAGFYSIVQYKPKRTGFAVVDSADWLHPDSLPAVSLDDPAAVGRLRAAAREFLSRGSQTSTGGVLGVTPFASTLIEKRGCAVSTFYHNLVFNDVAGLDLETRLAFLVFDVVEGGQDRQGFEPFGCDPSALVHVVRVDAPK